MATKEKVGSQERRIYERALTGLQLMSPTEALKYVLDASGYKRQIFLVAEEDGLNRGAILNRFPKVSDTMKEKLHGSA